MKNEAISSVYHACREAAIIPTTLCRCRSRPPGSRPASGGRPTRGLRHRSLCRLAAGAVAVAVEAVDSRHILIRDCRHFRRIRSIIHRAAAAVEADSRYIRRTRSITHRIQIRDCRRSLRRVSPASSRGQIRVCRRSRRTRFTFHRTARSRRLGSGGRPIRGRVTVCRGSSRSRRTRSCFLRICRRRRRTPDRSIGK